MCDALNETTTAVISRHIIIIVTHKAVNSALSAGQQYRHAHVLNYSVFFCFLWPPTVITAGMTKLDLIGQ